MFNYNANQERTRERGCVLFWMNTKLSFRSGNNGMLFKRGVTKHLLSSFVDNSPFLSGQWGGVEGEGSGARYKNDNVSHVSPFQSNRTFSIRKKNEKKTPELNFSYFI